MTYPSGRWSHCNGWHTQDDKKKIWLTWWSPERMTWLEKLMLPDCRVDLIIPDRGVLKTWCFSIAGLTWKLLLMTRLIFSFLWDFPNGRVHLIFFLFHDQNRFFVIINAMFLSLSTISLDFVKDFSVITKKYVCNDLRLDDMHASLPDLKYRSPLFDAPLS